MFGNRGIKVLHQLRTRSNQKAGIWTCWIGSRCLRNQWVGTRDRYRRARGFFGKWIKKIAVLAEGLQHIYSPENLDLADRICQQGALISESPLATKSVSHNFPIRNCVISGISHGILVTEASVKSGALITATFGQEQNREVFAVPGRIGSHPSSRCNQLISRNQAKLFTSATEILEDFLPNIFNKARIQLSFPEPSKQIILLQS